jgi:exodeoxyribonuclease V beta subunit
MGKNKPACPRADFLGSQTAMKREFDAGHTPLEDGFTVIEASAGTGKTTTIAAIVLRFLAEKEIPIERILVTTYTELATAELRGRIRETITDALGQRRLPFVDDIVTKVGDRKGMERRLKIALQSFDDASIFTIHGFCSRVLADRAFESGVPFEAELVTDQSRFLNEVADDFWRAHFYTDDTTMAALLRERLKPAQLVELLTQLTNNPKLRVTPLPEDRATLEKKIAQLCQAGADSMELTESVNRFVVSVQSEFCQWAREELPRRKADRGVQSFDDLLTRLDEALRGEEGGELRKSLRQRFAVALVDEFQDTDSVQYSIFSQIYDDGESSVFFIGDPKQAIYGFRGADVFTYLKAAKVANRYTLHENWRSEAKLVDGVSAIFDQRDHAFVIEGIDFPSVAASGKTDSEALTIRGQRDQPLRFWIASTNNRSRVGDAVAAEIASLLAGETKIGARKIEPRDIAVLVNTNAQPSGIQKALADYQIPSVVYSAASVLKSPEAAELLRILLAVAQPTHEKIARAALATEAFGLGASALEKLSSDEAEWEGTLNRFADYHVLWRDQGFVQMMRALLLGQKVRSRLLAWRDGDRRLTNLLHLIDLLHTASVENRFGIDALIKWLARQISGAGEGREDYELRLESDEDAVRIVTVHKSKGLEYGVTFCPFLRKEPWSRGKEFRKYHEDDELVLDLEELHREIQKREELAEMVRQLYVGLTRARHRSYLVWLGTSRKSKSALSWLFSEKVSADAFLQENGESDTSAKVRAAFAGSDAIAVEDLPDRDGDIFARPSAIERPVAPRVFGGDIDRSWRIASFSSLIGGRLEEPDAPDYDAVKSDVAIAEEPALPAKGIHAFPGGMRAGTCLHLILEELDFTDLSQLRPLVSRKLADFHFENYDDVVCEILEKTLRIPLGEDGVKLSEISRASRLSELEFTFPITTLTTSRLRRVFQIDELPIAIDRLQFAPANGFMKGFIDLVFERAGRFYFVDWKSNWLGADTSSYAQQSVAAEMTRNFYNLQLSIYTVAMHRYLQQRLADYEYEKNFGGAFYIFLRGIDPRKPTNGIFFARPPRKFVQQLNEVFHGNTRARN